jgi:hypothetical protein
VPLGLRVRSYADVVAVGTEPIHVLYLEKRLCNNTIHSPSSGQMGLQIQHVLQVASEIFSKHAGIQLCCHECNIGRSLFDKRHCGTRA